MDAAPSLLAAGEDRRWPGDTGAAKRLFLEARDGFVQQGIGYDAAMGSLDLTRMYLDVSNGRADGGTSSTSPGRWWRSSGAQDVHPGVTEAMAALFLFQDAARLEEVTAGLVRELTLYLEAAPVDPGLRWR